MLSNNAAIQKAVAIAEEADAEIAELKRIIAEKDAAALEVKNAWRDMKKYIGRFGE